MIWSRITPWLSLLIVAHLALLQACGPRSDHNYATESADPRAGLAPDGVAAESRADDNQVRSDQEPALLITQGVRQEALPSYQIPASIAQQIAKVQPNLVPAQNPTFQVLNPQLKIETTNSKITFTGVLRIPQRHDEPFELSCTINKAMDPWECRNLVPTNEKIALEKRFEGSFKCEDTWRCDKVGVKLKIAIDGKLQPLQIFQAERFHIRLATSGDQDETLQPEVAQSQVPAGTSRPPAPQAPAPPAAPVKPAPFVPRPPESTPPKSQPVPAVSPIPAVPPIPAAPVSNPVAAPTPSPTVPSIAPVQPRPFVPSATLSPPPVPAQDLTEKQVAEVLKDPNAAIEITPPMRLPDPSAGKFSIPNIERFQVKTGRGVPNQAVGSHRSGYLHVPAQMPALGPGFISVVHDVKDFGTDMTIGLLTQALAKVDKQYPGQPSIVVANIAKRMGGPISAGPGSHQTGLDADIGFPSVKGAQHFWAACPQHQGSCAAGAHISDEFDDKRFWFLLKQLTCAGGQPVIAMFLDREVKKHVCQFVQQKTNENWRDPKSCAFKTLQALKHETSHYHHVHVRFSCPGNPDCIPSLVSLADTTGC